MSHSKGKDISHRGRVVSVTPELTMVEIISEAACAACHAKALCGLGESRTKIVEVPTNGWENWQEGEEVRVVLKASMGHKAVWLAYVLPLIVLVAVILSSSLAGLSELAAGLSAIASVGVCYFLIWLFRGKLKNEYIFNITRQ